MNPLAGLLERVMRSLISWAPSTPFRVPLLWTVAPAAFAVFGVIAVPNQEWGA